MRRQARNSKFSIVEILSSTIFKLLYLFLITYVCVCISIIGAQLCMSYICDGTLNMILFLEFYASVIMSLNR